MSEAFVGETQIGRTVVDADGRTYTLASLIGGGGQGAVYATDQRNTLVKLFNDQVHDLHRAIWEIRRMPLAGLSVAAPMSVLDGGVGYVMAFQGDMTTAASLRITGTRMHPRDQWIDTGGLVRRLAIAARTAMVMEQLHAQGLVYGDLNRNNLMISAEEQHDVAALIDLDNLTYAGAHEGAIFYSPFFSAPEVACGRSAPTLESDAFSLAIVMFEIVTAVHPFKSGAAVAGMSQRSDAMYDAGCCLVPSAIDPVDTSNRCHAYPVRAPEQLIYPRLLDLLTQALGPGRLAPQRRPSAAALRSACVDALGDCVTCEQCQWSYALSRGRTCPNCDASTPTIELGIGFQGARVPSRRIQVAASRRHFDLALAFPSLARVATTPGVYKVQLSAGRGAVRVRADHDDYVATKPHIATGDHIEVKGLGVLEAVLS